MTKTQLWKTVLTGVLITSMTPAFGQLLVDSNSSCQSIGGQWTSVNSPPQIGICVLAQDYTVTAGNEMTIGAGVRFEISGWRRLAIESGGRLLVVTSAALELNSAYAENWGEISLSPGGSLDIRVGLLGNAGSVLNGGTIVNSNQGASGDDPRAAAGITNFGTLINSGLFDNAGIVESVAGSTLIVEANAVFLNSGYFRPRNLQILGEFHNHQTGVVSNHGRISTDQNGLFINMGRVELISLRYVDDNGEIRTEPSQFVNYGTTTNDNRFDVSHGAELQNFGQISNNGTIRNDTGKIENLGGSAQFVNTGSIDVFGQRHINGVLTSAQLTNDATLINDSLIHLFDNALLQNNHHLANNADIENRGGLFANSTSAEIVNPGKIRNVYGGGQPAVFDNAGIVTNPGSIYVDCLSIVIALRGGTLLGNPIEVCTVPSFP